MRGTSGKPHIPYTSVIEQLTNLELADVSITAIQERGDPTERINQITRGAASSLEGQKGTEWKQAGEGR